MSRLDLLRSYLTPEEPRVSSVICICGGVVWLVAASSSSNGGFGVFVGIVGLLLAVFFAASEWSSYKARIGRLDAVINRAAEICGAETLGNDFNCADSLTSTAKYGKEFLYFSKGPAIYHVSEIECAEVEEYESSDPDSASVEYYVKLRLQIGGRTFTESMNVYPDRWHLVGTGKKQRQTVEIINRWVNDWRKAHPEYNKEDS